MQDSYIEALRAMIKGHPGGLVAICEELVVDYDITRKEVSGKNGFKLGFEKAMHIAEECERAGGENCNALRAFMEAKRGASRAEKVNISEQVAGALKEVSDVVSVNARAAAHGYSPNSKREMRREVVEAIAQLEKVEQALGDDDGQPLRSVA